MARRPETFDELVTKLAPTETWEALAKRAGVSSRQMRGWRTGSAGARPYRPTIAKVAEALGCDFARVEAAIAASRAAAGK